MSAGYAVLIPARLGSQRLPGKVLLKGSGKYLIQHVYERALQAERASTVLVLTDDPKVEAAVKSFGGEVRMTRADHTSGTDRCAEAAADLKEGVMVNVQGDEPLFQPQDLAALARSVSEAGADIATLGWPFESDAQLADPNAVKAVVGEGGWALDFCRDGELAHASAAAGGGHIWHHVGIYAFRRERLLEFPGMAPTPREQAEHLEQLRALENGWRIQVLRASAPAFGVDTQADYDAFLAQAAGGP